MKRFLIMLLIASTLFSLSACVVEGEYPTLPPTTESDPVEETTNPSLNGSHIPENASTLSVAMPVITETEVAADGAILFKNIYQNMSLTLPNQDVADAVILDFLNRVDSANRYADAILTTAKENYTANDWTPYLCQVIYSPMRIDSGVLSLFGHYASYSGTPHPEADYLSVTYDLTTGSTLHLSDIFPDNTAVDTLIDLIVASLDTQKSEKMLFDDYADTVKGRIRDNFQHETAWFFNTDGLCFYFSPYEIAPYASGIITSSISYDQLAGLMNDAYFPEEKESVSGKLTASLFDESALQNYREFSEITIDNNGDTFLLSTDSAIYDIRIETGSWSANGNNYTAEYTLFAANILTKDTAVVLKTSTDTNLPTLRVSYKSGEKIVHQYLSCSKESINITTGV